MDLCVDVYGNLCISRVSAVVVIWITCGGVFEMWFDVPTGFVIGRDMEEWLALMDF